MMEPITHAIDRIPVSAIRVVNPRVRSKRSFRDLLESIESVGLKRPITVTKSPTPEDGFPYHLVCGQGRMEAFKTLGQSDIPAFVIEATGQEVMVRGFPSVRNRSIAGFGDRLCRSRASRVPQQTCIYSTGCYIMNLGQPLEQ